MKKEKKRYEHFDDEFEYEDEESKIDWKGIFNTLWNKKRLFIISAVVTFVVAVLLALTMPRYYAVEVTLAPEFATMGSSSSSSFGGLSSLMRSFGLNTTQNTSNDAILPTLYPDLMNSTAFRVSLFDVPVESKDGEIKTTYYDYLLNHQKESIWAEAIGGTIGAIMSLFPEDSVKIKPQTKANAGALTKKQTKIAKTISKKIVCDVDKKTGVITIDVKDQDPVICAAIADSTCKRLQDFITEYRTKKSRMEMENAQRQFDQAKEAYEAAKAKVEAFNDANWDLVDEDLIVQKQALQNEMNLQYTTLTAFNNQLMGARSKYEGMRPVFTVLDGATVPIKPAGPSRIKFVLAIMFLVLAIEAAVILIRERRKETATEPATTAE